VPFDCTAFDDFAQLAALLLVRPPPAGVAVLICAGVDRWAFWDPRRTFGEMEPREGSLFVYIPAAIDSFLTFRDGAAFRFSFAADADAAAAAIIQRLTLPAFRSRRGYCL
jgi:hypothetical protein